MSQNQNISPTSDEQEAGSSESEDSPDDRCSVCLEKFCMKTVLECDHAFCFLCIKGAVANQSYCPLCRQPVDRRFFLAPQICDNQLQIHLFEDDKLWYYQASNGWWMYERRDSIEIEKNFRKDPNTSIEKLISGRLYVIDFVAMIQYPKDNPSRARSIKRDKFDPSCRGIAGIRADFSALTGRPANTTP